MLNNPAKLYIFSIVSFIISTAATVSIVSRDDGSIKILLRIFPMVSNPNPDNRIRSPTGINSVWLNLSFNLISIGINEKEIKTAINCAKIWSPHYRLKNAIGKTLLHNPL